MAAEILTRHFQHGTAYGDFAILYRSNFQSRLLEQALREKQIGYRISGGNSFFDRSEIKDMLAYLKLMVNPDDDTAFLRCVNTPRREIGPNTIAKLGEHARARNVSLFAACHEFGLETVLKGRALQRLQRFANWLTLTADNAERGNCKEVIAGLFADIDYRGWLEQQAESPSQAERSLKNMVELLDWISRLLVDDEQRDRPLTDVVAQLSLHDVLSRQEDDFETHEVQMMTLHAAKGLEFPHVFMVGMEEDMLPHRNSLENDGIEEERRLAYVGMTRARHTLTFTRARSRQRYGDADACEPSRFLDELPADDVIILGELDAVPTEQSKNTGKATLRGLMDLLNGD